MTTRRSGAGVGVVDGLLYAVGGHDGPTVRKSAEVFNPQVRYVNLSFRHRFRFVLQSLNRPNLDGHSPRN